MRKFAGRFRRWPIHPQWLLGGREERSALAAACDSLAGIVVDIGCADRRVATYLPASCSYVGVDYPRTATDLYGTRPDVFADARRLPFRDASLDGIILKDVLEHVDGPGAALAECGRTLRDGGKLVLWMPFMYPVHDAPHDYQRFTRHGLEALLAGSGFEVVQATEVPKPIRTAGLLMSLALADACEQIVVRRKMLLPLLPFLVGLIASSNLCAYVLGFLPGGDFMPAFIRILAVRRGSPR